jgi:dihydroorotate dehydrogenase
MNFYKIVKPILFLLKPETAHDLSILALKNNLIVGNKVKNYPRLENKIFTIDFPNPLGMAAGYDKNAEVFNALNKFGFGFVECGTVTPKAQDGNPKPRLFRLESDKAVINKMGFNNRGVEYFFNNVEQKKHKDQIVGINIGKNKDTQDESADYLTCLEELYKLASYITINISSPNTKNLRNIQKEDILSDFLKKIVHKKVGLAKKHNKNIPILLKVAPDLEEKEIKTISKTILKCKIDGIIVSNTTIERPGSLKSDYKNEAGGLSGKPLLKKSNKALRLFYRNTKGKIPIIGVGGISSAQDAYVKIRLGASLVQIYSSLIYDGFYLVEKIKKELDNLLEKDGFTNISQAIGIDNKIEK